MRIRNTYSQQGLVHHVSVQLQKRDVVKLFCTVVAAELLCRWPATKKLQHTINDKIVDLKERTDA